MHGGIPSSNRQPTVRLATRGTLLFGLVLLLASCSSVQQGGPPARQREGAQIRGAVVTENHTLAAANSEARPLSADTSELLDTFGNDETEPLEAFGSDQAPHVPNQILVQYRTGAGATSFGTLSAGAGTELLRADANAGTAIVEVDGSESLAATLDRLSRDPSVVKATPNYYVYPTGLPNDPYLAQQWALASSGVPVAWDALPNGAEPVVLAVIDTGFDLDHQDLRGRFLPGYDFCANATCTATDSDPGNGTSGNWHGTHVAGVVGAVSDNGVGISGVTDASVRLLPIKIFNDAGGGANTALLIDALRWAAGLPVEGAPRNMNPARVINLSLAGNFSSTVVQQTIDEVREAGALVVASTGNSGFDRVMSPAAAEGVVGVGAMNRNFRRSCFSNYGVGMNGPGGVDILAPGGEADGSSVSCGIDHSEVHGLMSPIPGDLYGSAIGTSMAAPMVSGAAALILRSQPGLTVDELEERLLGSAYFDAGYMSESEYGAGILRADRALGIAGPGDTLRVDLTPEQPGEALSAIVSLELTGSSTSYAFDSVPAGRYSLSAGDPVTGTIYSHLSVSLADGEVRLENLAIRPRR